MRGTILGVLLGVLALARIAAAADLSRYDLPVGRVLTYSAESKSAKTDGTPSYTSRTTVRATVVAANADGSRRVVVRQGFKFDTQPEDVTVAAFDVFPDGRAARVGRFNADVSSGSAFPLLPPDAAAAAGTWAEPANWAGSVTTYAAAPSRAADEFIFTSVPEGLVNRLYGVTMKTTLHFDKRKGAVVGMESAVSQDYGTPTRGTGKTTLEKDEQIDPARAAALGAAYDQFFAAEGKYDEVLAPLSEQPERAAALIVEAKAVLTAAAKGVDEPEVAKEFERMLKEHDRNADRRLDDAKRLAALLNKPAADWEATDLDGKAWKQADLKGKVVVMDFWYRGCPWCMYAMPQVKQLAADYKDKGVVVLGMNTDTKEEDARFVVKELGLAYPQVKAGGIEKRFGIDGFPTLLVIDRDGILRGVHVGFSPDLRDKVARRIDGLLQK